MLLASSPPTTPSPEASLLPAPLGGRAGMWLTHWLLTPLFPAGPSSRGLNSPQAQWGRGPWRPAEDRATQQRRRGRARSPAVPQPQRRASSSVPIRLPAFRAERSHSAGCAAKARAVLSVHKGQGHRPAQ